MERAPLTKEEWLALEKKANDLRHLCLQTTVWAGSGHIGGGMSVMDILTVMYHRYLNIKRKTRSGRIATDSYSVKVTPA